MKVGFTGTQRGLTERQRVMLGLYLAGLEGACEEFHHGDCIGADAEAHELVRRYNVPVVIHPPDNSSKRAFCSDYHAAMPLSPYLARNRDIVDAVDLMIACPSGIEVRRSGTWATVRYARQK